MENPYFLAFEKAGLKQVYKLTLITVDQFFLFLVLNNIFFKRMNLWFLFCLIDSIIDWPL